MRDHFGWEYKGKHKDLKEAYTQLQRYREALENPPLMVVCDMDDSRSTRISPAPPSMSTPSTLLALPNPQTSTSSAASSLIPARSSPASPVRR